MPNQGSSSTLQIKVNTKVHVYTCVYVYMFVFRRASVQPVE